MASFNSTSSILIHIKDVIKISAKAIAYESYTEPIE